jgi:hypothetical protein
LASSGYTQQSTWYLWSASGGQKYTSTASNDWSSSLLIRSSRTPSYSTATGTCAGTHA